MKIRKIELPFVSSTLIESSGVDKDTAEGLALLLGYTVQDFNIDHLDYYYGDEVLGYWLANGDLSLYIDRGSEAEVKFLSLGGKEWIKKVLTGNYDHV